MKWNEKDDVEMTKRDWKIFLTGVQIGAFIGAMCMASALAWFGLLQL